MVNKIKISDKELVSLMMEKIKSSGTSSSGTYNRQDPTAFYKGSAKFDLYAGPSSDENGPTPETITIEFNDCTWGVEFKIQTSIGELSNYFDTHNKEWSEDNDVFFNLFKEILLDSADEGEFTSPEVFTFDDYRREI